MDFTFNYWFDTNEQSPMVVTPWDSDTEYNKDYYNLLLNKAFEKTCNKPEVLLGLSVKGIINSESAILESITDFLIEVCDARRETERVKF